MAKQQAKALTYPDDGILEVAIQKIRKWHFGIQSLATCFVPAAVLWLSLVIVSIARDNGVVIIPWFIWIPFLLFGILNVYTQKIRAKAIRTILESVAKGKLSATHLLGKLGGVASFDSAVGGKCHPLMAQYDCRNLFRSKELSPLLSLCRNLSRGFIRRGS